MSKSPRNRISPKARLRERIILRSRKVAHEAEQALRDIASLQDLHKGKADWEWLADEHAEWVKIKRFAQQTLDEMRQRR